MSRYLLGGLLLALTLITLYGTGGNRWSPGGAQEASVRSDGQNVASQRSTGEITPLEEAGQLIRTQSESSAPTTTPPTAATGNTVPGSQPSQIPADSQFAQTGAVPNNVIAPTNNVATPGATTPAGTTPIPDGALSPVGTVAPLNDVNQSVGGSVANQQAGVPADTRPLDAIPALW